MSHKFNPAWQSPLMRGQVIFWSVQVLLNQDDAMWKAPETKLLNMLSVCCEYSTRQCTFESKNRCMALAQKVHLNNIIYYLSYGWQQSVPLFQPDFQTSLSSTSCAHLMLMLSHFGDCGKCFRVAYIGCRSSIITICKRDCFNPGNNRNIL